MTKSHSNNPQIFDDRRQHWIVLIVRLHECILHTVFIEVFEISIGLGGPTDVTPEADKVLCLFILCVSL